MKLHEIQNVTSLPKLKLSSFDIENAKKADHYNTYDIWLATAFDNRAIEMYFIKDENDKIAGSIIGQQIKYDNFDKKTFIVSQTFVYPKHQNKGISTSLYLFLRNTKYFMLMSDKEQTSDGKRMWNSLIKKYPEQIKVIDIPTGKLIDRKNFPNNKLYHDHGEDRYRLVFEACLKPHPMFEHLARDREELYEKGILYRYIPYESDYMGLP